jgi:hypothetical protein
MTAANSNKSVPTTPLYPKPTENIAQKFSYPPQGVPPPPPYHTPTRPKGTTSFDSPAFGENGSKFSWNKKITQKKNSPAKSKIPQKTVKLIFVRKIEGNKNK